MENLTDYTALVKYVITLYERYKCKGATDDLGLGGLIKLADKYGIAPGRPSSERAEALNLLCCDWLKKLRAEEETKRLQSHGVIGLQVKPDNINYPCATGVCTPAPKIATQIPDKTMISNMPLEEARRILVKVIESGMPTNSADLLKVETAKKVLEREEGLNTSFVKIQPKRAKFNITIKEARALIDNINNKKLTDVHPDLLHTAQKLLAKADKKNARERNTRQIANQQRQNGGSII